MIRAVRSLLIAILAMLMVLPVVAQPVDQETYDLMVQTRDQVSEAIADIQWEQADLDAHYRDPDWIIYDTGDGVLTLDLRKVEEQARRLQLWLMIPGTRDIALSALKRTAPDLHKAIVEAERLSGYDGLGGFEDADPADIVERIRRIYPRSTKLRTAAYARAMDQLEDHEQKAKELLDVMNAELRKIEQERADAAEAAEPDTVSSVVEGENAIDALSADDMAGYRWAGDWQTGMGLLRLAQAGDGFEGTIESERGVARVALERLHTDPGDRERLRGRFSGPVGGPWLPEMTAERYGDLAPSCPEGAGGATSWGEIYLYGLAEDEFGGWWAPCDETWRIQIDHANFTLPLSGQRLVAEIDGE